MFKISVSRPGTSFTGGIYPEKSLVSAIRNYIKEGYTILSVENLSS